MPTTAAPPSSSFDQILNGHSLSLLANEERLLHQQRPAKSHTSLPQLARMDSVHKGSVYNYRQAVKSMMRSHEEAMAAVSMMGSSGDAAASDTTESDASTCSTRYEIIVAPPVVISAAQKRLERAKQAREKILNAPPIQRMNLNKMTILSPFEQTKILVNLDKVPSHVWTCLISKSSSTPKYHIPPARAYGFFKTNPLHSTSGGHESSGEKQTSNKMSSLNSKPSNGRNSSSPNGKVKLDL